jgi:regulator of nonsense transcripts 1
VLSGDHCQLPPTVTSREAERLGLGVSLFARLVHVGGVVPVFLDTQYRQHPLLAEFSAKEFYAGRLKSGIDGGMRPPPAGIRWRSHDRGIIFIEASWQVGCHRSTHLRFCES